MHYAYRYAGIARATGNSVFYRSTTGGVYHAGSLRLYDNEVPINATEMKVKVIYKIAAPSMCLCSLVYYEKSRQVYKLS